MNRELEKHPDPAELERRWYNWWMEKGLFEGDETAGGDPYTIVIPPPNVTGILHMGHALNNTIQDVLIRWQRMKGRNALWVPGTDHAGIATQNVVEKALAKEGITRDDLGREAFVERVWAWREQYGSTIVNQLKMLGASCDWGRTRFTMDEGLSDAVLEVFVRLYDKGLIYKGNYIINWCPRCRTALSDEESEHQDTNGHLWYIRYPIQGGTSKDYVTVATTRPETMLGDVAVAVNPRDERYRGLIGKTVILPVIERELAVIEDDFVDPEFGTGVVKVTPAHDPNDFELGQRHDLSPLNVMNEDATMNSAAGQYEGQSRETCRENLVADLERLGLLDRTEDHRHAVGHCYRCDTVVEPRLSPQWFVKMKPLARPAIDAVKDGRIKFVPERWTKVYLDWLENIRDWCISRQIWWGHRIPVFSCQDCNHSWAAKGSPTTCPSCGGSKIQQDPDVLDTWFSSWLWPFSVFDWPRDNESLKLYYPTQTLTTASEIIFFWVARMIMSGLEFMGDIPFSEVYIHGTVRDDDGLKMSKSLGNSIDPLEIIEKYSADSLRFSLMMLTATGQDVYVSDEKFKTGRNFGTKIWNAARFMNMHTNEFSGSVHEPKFDIELLSPDDQHILIKLHKTAEECEENLVKFRLNDAAKSLYEFFWHQYCDWYVEYSKEILYGDDEARKENTLLIMHHVFSSALRLLHPFMPFLTEELWHVMGYNTVHESIMIAPFPVALKASQLKSGGVHAAAESYVDAKHDLIREARILRANYNLTPSQKVNYIVKPASDELAQRLMSDQHSVATLLKAESITVDSEYEPDRATPGGLSRLGHVYMPLEGLIDIGKELGRLNRQIAKVGEQLDKVTRKLDNIDFVNRAPATVVEHEKGRKKDLLEEHEKMQQLIDMLSDSSS